MPLTRRRDQLVVAERDVVRNLERRFTDEIAVDFTRVYPNHELAQVTPSGLFEFEHDRRWRAVRYMHGDSRCATLARHDVTRQHAPPRRLAARRQRPGDRLGSARVDSERGKHRNEGGRRHLGRPATPVSEIGGNVIRGGQLGERRIETRTKTAHDTFARVVMEADPMRAAKSGQAVAD